MNPGSSEKSSASSHLFRLLGGRQVLVDQEGFLVDPQAWSEEAGLDMAREHGMDTLEEAHWKIIRFLRRYFLTHGKAPLHRDIRIEMGTSLLEIEALFPGGLKTGARQLAGLPNPRGCM
jgi:dissimilatory sulfite reductase related protein